MDKTQELAVIAALNKMFKDGWVCICTIDRVIKIMNVLPQHRAYEILSTLHCVHFKDMSPELVDQIPNLVRECLGTQTIFQFETLQQQTITVNPFRRLVRLIK